MRAKPRPFRNHLHTLKSAGACPRSQTPRPASTMPSSSRVAADARTSSVVSADRRSALAAADRYALHGSLPHGDPASASPTAAVATLAITGEPRSPPKPRTPSKPTPAAHVAPMRTH